MPQQEEIRALWFSDYAISAAHHCPQKLTAVMARCGLEVTEKDIDNLKSYRLGHYYAPNISEASKQLIKNAGEALLHWFSEKIPHKNPDATINERLARVLERIEVNVPTHYFPDIAWLIAKNKEKILNDNGETIAVSGWNNESHSKPGDLIRSEFSLLLETMEIVETLYQQGKLSISEETEAIVCVDPAVKLRSGEKDTLTQHADTPRSAALDQNTVTNSDVGKKQPVIGKNVQMGVAIVSGLGGAATLLSIKEDDKGWKKWGKIIAGTALAGLGVFVGYKALNDPTWVDRVRQGFGGRKLAIDKI